MDVITEFLQSEIDTKEHYEKIIHFITSYEIRKGKFKGNKYIIEKINRDSFILYIEYQDIQGKIIYTPSIAPIISQNRLIEFIEEYIKKQFNLKIIHQIYQATEGFLACTCEYGHLHLNEDLIKFEKKYIDDKRFYPIITDFRRTSQPFVSYYLNDILVEAKEPCECGSVLQRIEKIEGRSDDIFKFINKSDKEVIVFPDFIRRTILFVENIREYQVFQINNNLLEVAILNITEEQKELIKKEFNKLFTSLEIENIEIKFINYEIDKTKKLKRIVRKVIE